MNRVVNLVENILKVGNNVKPWLARKAEDVKKRD